MEAAEREWRLVADVRSLARMLQDAGHGDLAQRFHEDANRVERGGRYRLDVLWTDLGHDEWPTPEVHDAATRVPREAEAINRSVYGE